MMEITEVKTKKLELEKELYRLISKFENTSGTCITSVDMPSTHKYRDAGGSSSHYREYRLTVSVEVMS